MSKNLQSTCSHYSEKAYLCISCDESGAAQEDQDGKLVKLHDRSTTLTLKKH